MHLALIKVVYYQLMHKRIVLKMSTEIYIEIAPTWFGVITISRELCELVHTVRSLMIGITPKHVGAILMQILILIFKTILLCIIW